MSGAYLGYSIKRPADIENSLRVTRNALRDHDASSALVSDLIDMRTTLSNDN
jgi:hypothetical protein